MKSKNKVDTALEASAVAPIGQGNYVLVADDRTKGVFVVNVRTGKEVARIYNGNFKLSASIKKNPFIKWEAMAYDGHYYYLLSSHTGGLKYYQVNSYLIRFALTSFNKKGIPNKIMDVSRFYLDQALTRKGVYPPDKNGDLVKLEGLAIWDGRLAIGVRQAVDLKKSFRIYLSDDLTSAKNGDQLAFVKQLDFEAGVASSGTRFELSSLEYVPRLKGFLVTTASEDDENNFFENKLWLVSKDTPHVLREITSFGYGMKAEGICVLPYDHDDTLRLMITYDNDPHTTKNPSRFQIVDVHVR